MLRCGAKCCMLLCTPSKLVLVASAVETTGSTTSEDRCKNSQSMKFLIDWHAIWCYSVMGTKRAGNGRICKCRLWCSLLAVVLSEDYKPDWVHLLKFYNWDNPFSMERISDSGHFETTCFFVYRQCCVLGVSDIKPGPYKPTMCMGN